MKNKIDLLLTTTIRNCFDRGHLKRTSLPAYVIEIPNNPDHGDFATNLPLALAASQKRPPREIARLLVEHLEDKDSILEKAEIAGPGFINFRIRTGEWQKQLARILDLRGKYGSATNSRERILVEYVSANPTGPLHLGHGRGAALGDALCRILSFRGYDVVREFYINDAGQQIRLLGESVYSRWKQMSNPDAPFPEHGYHGDYILDLAEAVSRETDLSQMDPEQAIEICADRGRKIMLDEIRQVLEEFRVSFDVWFKESDLYSRGLVEQALGRMNERGELFEKDGALWIHTSAFGDDKDRVIKKNDGQFTYFAADIAYHLDKWNRGFTRAVNLWGADHHGYIGRVISALKANGIDENWLSVLTIQLVKLWREGREVKMSKRAGRFVTLKELVDEVGVDAVRFVFLTKTHDSPLDFDIDLVKRKDSDNPVYYVQYAHARICSIFRKASSEGIDLPADGKTALHGLLLKEEIGLIKLMEQFPSVLQDICRSFEVHRLTYYLSELAAHFHRYFNLGTKIAENRIVTGDIPLSRARLALAEAVRLVLSTGLNLLGVHAPEKM